MESIIKQIGKQKTWEEFLAYRLLKGRFNWHEFDKADTFVEKKLYIPVTTRILCGKSLSVPTKKLVNKSGTGKKRVVYCYPEDEMLLLKIITHLLYRYDDMFAPNCYAFRKGIKAHNAIFDINNAIRGKKMWAYKTDIHNYFNSINVSKLIPMLSEMFADDPELYDFFEKMLNDNRAIMDGEIVEDNNGVMAGTPTASFLADVYLKDVDWYFHNLGIIYARYSDDIILFAPDKDTLEDYKNTLLKFLNDYDLEINTDKEKIYSPDEAYEFLGFKCHNNSIDISTATKVKIKGKIKRKARALMRWSTMKQVSTQTAMKCFIRSMNQKFFDSDDPETLNWSRWFFPVINQTNGLKDIDHYFQQNIRFLTTGKHSKANFRTDYSELKNLGYRSLVNEYYKTKDCIN